MPKLTDEMREALQDKTRQPVQVEDEQTHRQYVLLPLEVYQRVRSIFRNDEFDIWGIPLTGVTTTCSVSGY
ncbi:MAG: hypothetical protein WCJ35_20705, partial [Planctomycetota bacterium]